MFPYDPGLAAALPGGPARLATVGQKAAMSHAALVDNALVVFVVALTLLLAAFICAVIWADPEAAGKHEPSAVAPARAPPVWPQAPPPPPLPLSPTGDIVIRRGRLLRQCPVISPARASDGPRQGLVTALILVIAGLPMAAIGGWLFLTAGKGAVRCSHQAVAICSQGFVVLPATQLLGIGNAVAGIVFIFTTLALALR